MKKCGVTSHCLCDDSIKTTLTEPVENAYELSLQKSSCEFLNLFTGKSIKKYLNTL